MTSYKTGWPVGALFVAINLPFFILAQRRLGWMFTLKSAAAMAAIALFSMLMPRYSALSAIALSLVMFAYHRPGRYAGH